MTADRGVEIENLGAFAGKLLREQGWLPPGDAAALRAEVEALRASRSAPPATPGDEGPEDPGLAPPGDLRAEIAGWRRLAAQLGDDDRMRVTLYRCASRIESHLSAAPRDERARAIEDAARALLSRVEAIDAEDRTCSACHRNQSLGENHKPRCERHALARALSSRPSGGDPGAAP